MRIALVQDMLIRLGGAERVLHALSEIYPDAPIYTLLYDPKAVGHVFPPNRVRTSRLNKLPKFIRTRQKYLLPFMAEAVEQWDFSEFDVVISSSTAFAHGIVTPSQTRHISYCHSPMRFAWDWTHEYMADNKLSGLTKKAVERMLHSIRMWDKLASDRVDTYVTNSQNVSQRIQKYYRRDATVIYPPVDITRFKVSKEHDTFFLIVSQLTPYKRIDLAIHLFNKLQKRLIIIGDGPQREYLQSIAGPSVQLMGYQNDETVNDYLQRCRAFVFPGEEDFGIAPVEAMACGKPILAYGKGGALESVVEGITGEFFHEATVASMEDGLARLIRNEKKYDPDLIRKRAAEFSKKRFTTAIKKLVSEGNV